jgi:hypothetical protein
MSKRQKVSGRMRSPAIVFDVGGIYGGVRILAKTVGEHYTHEDRYQVSYLCCGRVAQLAHASLRQRVSHDRTACHACASAANARAAHDGNREAAAQRRLARELSPGTVRDTRGQVWPKLGRMGPRWAGGEHHRLAEVPVE